MKKNSRINSSKLTIATWNIHGNINNAANLEHLRNDLWILDVYKKLIMMKKYFQN